MLKGEVTKFIQENAIFCALLAVLMVIGLVNSLTKKKNS